MESSVGSLRGASLGTPLWQGFGFLQQSPGPNARRKGAWTNQTPTASGYAAAYPGLLRREAYHPR